MARIIVSPQAEQDLAQIVDEISSRAGPSIADNLFIDHRDHRQVIHSAEGVRPTGAGPRRDLRCHPIGADNVYLRYDEAADTLFVVRVLHGRRNITAALFEK